MGTAIFELCATYVSRLAALDPVYAAHRGIASEADHTDYGPEGAAARMDLDRETLRRLADLRTGNDTPATSTGKDNAATTDADRRAAAHLGERLGSTVAWYELGEWRRNVCASFGLLHSVRDTTELMPRGDDDAWRAVARRLAAVPVMLRGWRASLDLGLAEGRAAARRQAIETAAVAETYATTKTHDPLVRAYGGGPLAAELAAAAEAAYRGYAELARYLRDDYAPRATEADGVGAERHAVWLRQSLGADIDPHEAYEWAWAELHRLETEIEREAATLRPGAAVDEVVEWLDATVALDGPDVYRAWLQEQHDLAIERLDGVHFDIAPALRTVEVMLAPPGNAGGVWYNGPSEDGSRPGSTWWSVNGRRRFAVWNEMTTVFHEGVPGHHLQVGQARLAGAALSRFSRVAGVPGHSEGWALYAERLADELGWYARPGERLGMLMGSSMRAARVIVDIGLHLDLPIPPSEVARHGPKWTFEVACEVMASRGRAAAHRVHGEVVRYCGWPAQASAYKLGERVWVAARAEAARRPGFDLKAWHTAALSLGPVGLGTLVEELRRA